MLISQPHDISIAVGFVHIVTTSSSVCYFPELARARAVKLQNIRLYVKPFFWFLLPLQNTCAFNQLLAFRIKAH